MDGHKMEAIWILIICSVGLILLAAYLIYIVSNLRKKQKDVYDMAREIGSMEKDSVSPVKKTKPSMIDTPMLPEDEVLVILHKENRKPWMKLIRERSREGSRIIYVSKKDPNKVKVGSMGHPYYIWLDRSTAHKEDKNISIINPTNLSRLLQEIQENIKKDSIVLIDDLEGLISENDASRVISFLSMVRTSCARSHFSVIAPAPYRAIPQRTRSKLTESFETVVI
jgi:hypothetical protein